MGIKNFLQYLPGGSMDEMMHSFYESPLKNESLVPWDAAGALFEIASHNAVDYLQGNYRPALVEWARLLNFFRSICRIKSLVALDRTQTA